MSVAPAQVRSKLHSRHRPAQRRVPKSTHVITATHSVVSEKADPRPRATPCGCSRGLRARTPGSSSVCVLTGLAVLPEGGNTGTVRQQLVLVWTITASVVQRGLADAVLGRHLGHRTVVGRHHLAQRRLFAFVGVSRPGSLVFAPVAFKLVCAGGVKWPETAGYLAPYTAPGTFRHR